MTHATQGRESDVPAILIVEDEQIVAADIHHRLERMGYRVPAIASSGEEALRSAEELRPDLLLMDIVLEGTPDGIQTVQEIHSRMDVPVVYLTAYGDEETVRRAKATRPFGFVLKPFDERELHYTIEMALENHRAERELRRTEEIFRDVAEHSDQVQWLLDAGLTATLYVNPAFESIWGMPRPAPGTGLEPWLSSVHQEDQEDVKGMYEKARLGEFEPEGIEYRVLRPDGTQRWVWTRIFPIHGRSGAVIRIAGIGRDITRQKWAWDTLRESEERYRLLAENATDMISRHTTEGVFLFASPASRSVLGYKPEDLLGRSLAEFVHPDDLHALLAKHRSLHEALASGALSYRAKKSDGSFAWIETTTKIVRDPLAEEAKEISAVSRDIGTRRERDGDQRLSAVMTDTAGELMALINHEYVHEAANEAYCRAHGKSREDLLGQSLRSVWLEETFNAVIKGPVDKCLTGKEVTYESWFTFKQLGRRCFDMRHYPYRNKQGEVTHCLIVGLDVTSRKTAEDQARTTLKEKDVLLKEVHHRVKNNLQVISSLLNLQLNVISNKESREIVRESQNRLRSMALIHEKLYQSESYGELRLEDYLRSLTREIFRSYGPSGVNLRLEVDDIRLDVDTTIPCGLIVNELVSNALKYAFPGGRPGEVHIKAQRTSKDRIALSVSDDGVGLPQTTQLRTARTLGFQLIQLLVKQLRGTLDIVRNGGTTFMITFPVR
jgi:PAS domain S-box-containing protein